MITTDIYGFAHDDMDVARTAVESALEMQLEEHDSIYLGQYFRGSVPKGPSVKLQQNADPMHDPQSDPPEERFVEPEFECSPLLLYVSGESLDALRQTLPHRVQGLAFLRRRETA